MVQPIKNKAVKCNKKKIVTTKKRKKHKEYGTSKLEITFAKNFLDKLGVKYIYQFKAESIGRYYDYMLPDHGLIIEIDGDFYHSYGMQELFDMPKKTIRTLMNLAEKTNTKVEEPIIIKRGEQNRFSNAPSLAFMEQNLFRPDGSSYVENIAIPLCEILDFYEMTFRKKLQYQ